MGLAMGLATRRLAGARHRDVGVVPRDPRDERARTLVLVLRHLAMKSLLTGFRGEAPGFEAAPLNIVLDP